MLKGDGWLQGTLTLYLTMPCVRRHDCIVQISFERNNIFVATTQLADYNHVSFKVVEIAWRLCFVACWKAYSRRAITPFCVEPFVLQTSQIR